MQDIDPRAMAKLELALDEYAMSLPQDFKLNLLAAREREGGITTAVTADDENATVRVYLDTEAGPQLVMVLNALQLGLHVLNGEVIYLEAD